MTVTKNTTPPPPTPADLDDLLEAFQPVMAVMRRFVEQVLEAFNVMTKTPTWQALLREIEWQQVSRSHRHARRWRRRTYAARRHPDAMRLDASRAEADAELAEWRAFVEGMK